MQLSAGPRLDFTGPSGRLAPGSAFPLASSKVKATNGVILALRTCSYSPEFTRSFHRAIHDQAEHERAVADVVRRLNTDQIWERCAIRCEGGA